MGLRLGAVQKMARKGLECAGLTNQGGVFASRVLVRILSVPELKIPPTLVPSFPQKVDFSTVSVLELEIPPLSKKPRLPGECAVANRERPLVQDAAVIWAELPENSLSLTMSVPKFSMAYASMHPPTRPDRFAPPSKRQPPEGRAAKATGSRLGRPPAAYAALPA